MVPTHKMFVAFSLCSSQNELKTKGYENKDKARTTLESYYAGKRPGKNTPNSKNVTVFNRWQKWPFCKGYSKAKWSQMVSTGTDPQNTKNIQGRMENQEIRNHTPVCRDLHTLVDTWSKIEKRTWRVFRNDYFSLLNVQIWKSLLPLPGV